MVRGKGVGVDRIVRGVEGGKLEPANLASAGGAENGRELLQFRILCVGIAPHSFYNPADETHELVVVQQPCHICLGHLQNNLQVVCPLISRKHYARTWVP